MENSIEIIRDIAEKLKQYCLQLSHQNVFKKDYHQALQNEVLAFVKGHPDLLVHPAIAIYYYGYQAIFTGEDTYFQTLLSLLPQHKKQFEAACLVDDREVSGRGKSRRANSTRQRLRLYRA